MSYLEKEIVNQKVQFVNDQLVYSIFLVNKKNGVHWPVVTLKALNKFILYAHFKMKGLNFVKEL